ncbi:hypothetical protein JAAARDRAFT_206891 [Jaapia argillacea MUCL 33604]|uniref:F-box domain-containing protein n=1 Tax=Jaapia argillacea MUCL 33604 TaxID=933084 RepID=A0A067PTT1_9AGAM|nr:hypothetical protein JAAARDRAFT_206891 [Jaapia argillacea MUCL 33604]
MFTQIVLTDIFPREESLALLCEASRSNTSSIIWDMDLAHERLRAEEDIITLEAQICKLWERLRTLNQQLAGARMRKGLANSFTASPIRKLPPEVLARIFTAAQADKIMRRADVLDPFLQVCWHWRQVALNPVIWSTICVEYNSSGEDPAELVPALGHLLQRSSNTRLDIAVAVEIPLHWHTFGDVNVFSVFSPHVHRLGNVLLRNMRHCDDMAVLLCDMANGSPRLETLTLCQWDHEGDLAELFQDIQSFVAPRLRSLSLHRGWNPRWLPFPWSQLTHLRFGDNNRATYYSVVHCFDVLRQCVQLTHCWIHCRTVRDPPVTFGLAAPRPDRRPPSINQNRIILPKLYFLSVTLTPDDHLFFQRLHAPRLAEPKYIPHGGPQTMRGFQSWVMSTSCPPTKLIVDLRKEWMEFLELFPTVVHLHFNMDLVLYPEDRAVLEALRLSRGRPNSFYMPRMQTLSFVFRYSDGSHDFASLETNVDAAISLIVSRCSPLLTEQPTSSPSTDVISPLRYAHLSIPSCAGLQEYIEARLADCLTAGLRVHIEIVRA